VGDAGVSAAPRSIGILAFDGVDDTDLLPAVGLLKKAALLAEDGSLRTAVWGAGPSIMTAGGVRLTADVEWSRTSAWSAVVVPGGSAALTAPLSEDVHRELRAHVAASRPVYCICSGVWLLARVVSLKDMRVACPVSTHDVAGMKGAHWVDDPMTSDRWLITVARVDGVGLKSIRIATAVLRDLQPRLVNRLEARLGHALPT
jgi:putative intracellular protease/amidase